MRKTKLINLAFGFALSTVSCMQAFADDTEIFFGNRTSASAPNIMFILDTSGSMNGPLPTYTEYDPNTPYGGTCSSGSVYYKAAATGSGGTTTPPTCGAAKYIATSSFKCTPATTAVTGAFAAVGWYQDAAIMWTQTQIDKSAWTETIGSGKKKTTVNHPATSSTTYTWSNVVPPPNDSTSGSSPTTKIDYTAGDITCEGNVSTDLPNNNNPVAGTEWTTTAADSYWATGGTRTQYYFYDANYLNWYNGSRVGTPGTRLSVMQLAAKNVLSSLSGVNVGLMRYNTKGSGGMVVSPMDAVENNRASLIAEINSWKSGGDTPLTESLYESYLYFTGSDVNFGNNSYTCSTTSSSTCSSGNFVFKPSVPASRDSTSGTITLSDGSTAFKKYASPMKYSCQPNYVVFLTDGEPTGDTAANVAVNGLSSTDAACTTGTSGACLNTLTTYMYQTDLKSGVDDKQNIITHFIGFGSDVSGGAPFTTLDTAAKLGGGSAHAAGDIEALTQVLNDIVLEIRNDSTSFTSPTVAVNSFNKTQVLEDMYVSVFQPTQKTHWPGNLKKYKLRDGVIIGQSGPAVNSNTGFFADTAQSYWSTTVDGRTTTLGGVANLISTIGDPTPRKVYTHLTGNRPFAPQDLAACGANCLLNDANTSTTLNTRLNLGGASDPTRTDLLSWVNGQDVLDVNKDKSTTDARHQMGDPVHSQPAVVIYGQTGTTDAQKLQDAVVYVATNDGFLHAFSTKDGKERWSFVPRELIGDLKNIYNNAATTGNSKHYSLDGNIRVLKYDIDANGTIDGNDRVILYVSMGRGGQNYYALDITNKDAPKFMWSLDSTDLPNLGQSWSTPALGRVKVSGTSQNTQYFVLFFGGGYDPLEDNVSYIAADSVGKGIYMVDAVNGNLLWSAGYTGLGANFQSASMTHAIPSDVRVIDTNADGYSDRIYVGDMAGQLWRFDFASKDIDTTTAVENDADNIAAGGVIASLGSAAESTATNANNRRFYNVPDVALFNVAGSGSYYNIAIGSGYRGHPKNTATDDRFYSLRDPMPHTPMTQDEYDKLTPILDTDSTLTDISASAYGTTTTPGIGINGWKLALSSAGEKVLSPAVTADNVVMFTTFTPATGVATSCKPTTGTARAYALFADSGVKRFGTVSQQFATNGLSTNIQLLPANLVNTGDGVNGDDTSGGGGGGSGGGSGPSGGVGRCLSGVTILSSCVHFGDRVKTYWEASGIN